MLLRTGRKKGFVVEGDEFSKEVVNLPGSSFLRREGVIRIPENQLSAESLSKLEFEYVTPEARRRLKALLDQRRARRRKIRFAESRFKRGSQVNLDVPIKTTPMDHQVRAFGFSTHLDNSALFMDQGTGKTLVAIGIAGKRFKDGLVKRLLVVCPKSVKPVWPRELRKHAAFRWNHSLDRPPRRGIGLEVMVTNYDRVQTLLKTINKWKPQMVILDESHKIKNRKARRSKAVHKIKTTFRLLLSGTPFSKCISEVWSQFKFLDPNIFGSNYSYFKEKYLRMGGYMGYKVVGVKNEEEFTSKLHSVCFRVLKEECLDLPPLTVQNLYVTPSAKTMKVYEELNLHLYTETEDGEITVPSEAVKQMKLRQVVGGQVRVTKDQVARISDDKVAALREFMEDRHSKKTLIFFSFTHEIDSVAEMCKKLKLSYTVLDGRTKDRDKWEENFQKSSVEVGLIQVDTGGEGITLTAADVTIFYSPSFNYTSVSQARDRIYRIGQKKSCLIIFMVVEKTVDEEVVSVLESNRQLVDKYLNQARNYSNVRNQDMSKYTVKELAASLKITPAEARKALRGSGVKKPEEGWNWESKKAAAEVEKAVAAYLANSSKKEGKKAKKGEEEKAPAKKASKKPAQKKVKKAADPE